MRPHTIYGLLSTTAALLCIHSTEVGDFFAASAEWCVGLLYLSLASRRRH